MLDKEACLTLVDNEDYLRGLPEGALMLAEELHGVDRFAARKKVVARLEDFGFIEKIEPNTHMVPHGDRSNVVIEPYLTDQWYVDAQTLALQVLSEQEAGFGGPQAELQHRHEQSHLKAVASCHQVDGHRQRDVRLGQRVSLQK